MFVIETGFQYVTDSYFWYLPFTNQRKCTYVLDVLGIIPEDEWMSKRADLSASTKLKAPGMSSGRVSRTGLLDLYKQFRANGVVIPDSTKVVILDD
jgi:hypothetical protein